MAAIDPVVEPDLSLIIAVVLDSEDGAAIQGEWSASHVGWDVPLLNSLDVFVAL